MAIVTRYFSSTSAGNGDGTSWANRAALFSAGNWSSVITGFNFSGSDSLECRIEGNVSYTCSQSLSTGLFANAPSAVNPLLISGCDSTGAILAIPNAGWVSSQGKFSTSTLPTIATSTNIVTCSLTNVFFNLIDFTASNCQQAMFSNGNATWCSFTNSTSNASAAGISVPNHIRNCQVTMSGTSFDYGISHAGSYLSNMRIDGSAATSSGTRIGVTTPSSNNQTHEYLTIIGCSGGGYFAATGSTTRWGAIKKSLIINCGVFGFRGNPTASQTVWHGVFDCVIVNSVIGIDGQSAARILISNCRLRNNTTANTQNLGNYTTSFSVNTSSGNDADEFVNTSTGDYRIKRTSSFWGKGLGPGDEPSSGGGASLTGPGGLVY